MVESSCNKVAPKKANRIAGIPKIRMVFQCAFFPTKKTLKILFKKCTIAVKVMAISIGKTAQMQVVK